MGDELRNFTIKELRLKLQATAPEGEHETYVGRSVRFFSVYFTRLFARTRVTPNELTTISVLIFLFGLSLFICHNFWLNLVGCLLVYFSVIVDACDGETARLTGNKSGVGGIYVEPFSHDIQYALMFIPLTLGVYFSNHNLIIIYIGFLATIFKLLFRFALIRFLAITSVLPVNVANAATDVSVAVCADKIGFLHRMYRFINRNIFSSVGLIIPLLICSLFNRLDIFIWLFAVGFGLVFFANFIHQIGYIIKLSR